MKKRILSMLLALVMLATLLPLGLIDTAEAAATHSGTCGDNVTWTLDANGTLTISGKGAMADYYIFSVPWYDTRSQVKTVIIKNGVTSIGNCAFADCSSLTSATIPNSVTGIGNWAFFGCSSLTSATIPDSVTSIGEDAFNGCKSLTSVTIPESVTSIGDQVVVCCKSLTNVTIPKSVTRIGFGAFSGSNATITVASGNSEYCSVAGALYNKQKTTLFYPGMIKDGSFRIPNSEFRYYYCERCVLQLLIADQRDHPRQCHQHRVVCVRELLIADPHHHPQ